MMRRTTGVEWKSPIEIWLLQAVLVNLAERLGAIRKSANPYDRNTMTGTVTALASGSKDKSSQFFSTVQPAAASKKMP